MKDHDSETLYLIAEDADSTYSVCMSGCPVDDTDDIQVEDSRLAEGECLTVRGAASLWSIIPGKEKSLYDLYIVIGGGARSVFRRAVRKFKKLLIALKGTELVQKPCILRL